MVILGVGQMGLGLAFLTLGARLIPAAEVALITLLEIVLAPLWVWLTILETPATATLVGGVVLIAAVILQVGGEESPDAAIGRRRSGGGLATSRTLLASCARISSVSGKRPSRCLEKMTSGRRRRRTDYGRRLRQRPCASSPC